MKKVIPHYSTGGVYMEEVVNTFVMRHKSGVYMNYFFERVRHIRSAARFDDHKNFEEWINGHHKPSHPEEYEIVPFEITYRVVES